MRQYFIRRHAKIAKTTSNTNMAHPHHYSNTDADTGFIKTLQFLKSHQSEYLSGQDLGDVLGISRVAVWKHIKNLRRIGYTIESKQKIGYKLTHMCDEPYPWEIAHGVNTRTIGKQIHYYDTTKSTQDVIADLDAKSKYDTGGTVVISARQSHARGRMNRKWMSPYGGIYMSVALHPACGADAATLFPLAVGVAIAKSIKDACRITAQLKWPNDITIQDKKVAGIITEAELEYDCIQKIYIGIGINFDLDANVIKKEFADVPGFYGATTIIDEAKKQKNSTKNISKTNLVKSILSNMENTYDRLMAGQSGKIITEWNKYSSTIGRRISATKNGKQITGTALKIADNGMLVVNCDNKDNAGEQAVLMAGTVRYITE